MGAGIFETAAEGLLDQAEKAFMNDQPREAASLLEEAQGENPGREEIYNYLGIAYQQMDRLDKAAQTFREGIELGGSLRETMQFNLGNVYMTDGEYRKAVEIFGRVISGGGEFRGQAQLNRANSYLKIGEREKAIEDYSGFLDRHPQDSQASTIRELISLLRGELEEEARLAEERRRQKEEEEQRRREEKERQEALMADIMNSLGQSSSDTSNMSAESEDIEIEEEESGIDD